MVNGHGQGHSLIPAYCKTIVSVKNIVRDTCCFGLLSACSIEDHGLTAEGHIFICSSVTWALKVRRQCLKQRRWLLKTKLWINVCITIWLSWFWFSRWRKQTAFRVVWTLWAVEAFLPLLAVQAAGILLQCLPVMLLLARSKVQPSAG